MTLPIAISIIGLGISILVFLSNFYFSSKNSKRQDHDEARECEKDKTKEIEERLKERIELNAKLDLIANTTNEIKSELSSMKMDIKTHHDRIIIVEQSMKSFHHRLDGVEERLNLIEKEE